LSPLDELVSHLSGPSRAIVISNRDVDLRAASAGNRLFILKIGEGSLAAGGRGGGFGERKVTGVLCFENVGGAWTKRFEVDGAERASKYEVPYHVSRLPMVMADGVETMGYGVVDPDLVAQMSEKSGIGSSA
jgi:hypothetical protein